METFNKQLHYETAKEKKEALLVMHGKIAFSVASDWFTFGVAATPTTGQPVELSLSGA